MKTGDLVELSERLPEHGGRFVRVLEVTREWDDATGRVDEWLIYEDPDGKLNELGMVMRWKVLSHMAIRAREQRPDYAAQDADMRKADRLRARSDAALKMRLQRLGLVRVPRRT